MKKIPAPVLSLAIGLVFCGATQPTAAQTHKSAYSEVRLISESSAVVPGDTAWLGLHIKTKPGWHTYWRNPGDSGLATRIAWSLPDGLSAGDIRWPIPKKFTFGPLASYGYKDETLLMVPVSIGEEVPQGKPVMLNAEARWLVCEEICVPERANFSVSLPVTDKSTGPRDILFERFRTVLPANPVIRAEGRQSEDGIRITAALPEVHVNDATQIAFFPATEGAIEASAPMKVGVKDRKLVIDAKPGYLAEESKLISLEGVLVVQPSSGKWTERKGFRLKAEFEPSS